MAHKVSLIIPDLHHRWQEAEHIIASVKHDEVIFLGDYFDDFHDDLEMVQGTADWLTESVNKPNRIHLWGNHDVHYAFVYRVMQCAGYEQWKYFAIHDRVPSDLWDKLKWYHILDNTWLLTHAGLHNAHVTEKIHKLSGPEKLIAIGEYIDEGVIQGFRAAAENRENWCFGSGMSRGGRQPFGGIIWCDYEQEFIPIKGVNQILGHTPQGAGIAKWCIMNSKGKVEKFRQDLYVPTKSITDPECSVNIDLDVYKNTHYALWDGKKLSVAKCGKLTW